jgi:hypothetical protein
MKAAPLTLAKERVNFPAPPVTNREKQGVEQVREILLNAGFDSRKIRFFEEANFFCILNTDGVSLRFSAYYPIFTIDSIADTNSAKVAGIINIMRNSGFLYISEADLGGQY